MYFPLLHRPQKWGIHWPHPSAIGATRVYNSVFVQSNALHSRLQVFNRRTVPSPMGCSLHEIHYVMETWSLPSGRRMSSGLTLYFLWVLEWPTRPILAVNCRPQSSQVKRLVSSDLAAGTDWLVKLFRRLRFSTAVTTDNTNFLKVLHLDLLSARSSQAMAYIGVQVVTRNGWVDIAARQTTGESYTTAWLFVII